MSIKINLVEKANPSNRSEKKWYANAVSQGIVGQREIANIIASKSSLTPGDVSNVIENLLEEVPRLLADGKSVRLGELGIFRISLSSEGAPTKEAFHFHLIKKVRILFSPGKLVKGIINSLHFERL